MACYLTCCLQWMQGWRRLLFEVAWRLLEPRLGMSNNPLTRAIFSTFVHERTTRRLFRGKSSPIAPKPPLLEFEMRTNLPHQLREGAARAQIEVDNGAVLQIYFANIVVTEGTFLSQESKVESGAYVCCRPKGVRLHMRQGNRWVHAGLSFSIIIFTSITCSTAPARDDAAITRQDRWGRPCRFRIFGGHYRMASSAFEEETPEKKA